MTYSSWRQVWQMETVVLHSDHVEFYVDGEHTYSEYALNLSTGTRLDINDIFIGEYGSTRRWVK